MNEPLTPQQFAEAIKLEGIDPDGTIAITYFGVDILTIRPRDGYADLTIMRSDADGQQHAWERYRVDLPKVGQEGDYASLTIEYSDGTEASVQVDDETAERIGARIESLLGRKLNLRT